MLSYVSLVYVLIPLLAAGLFYFLGKHRIGRNNHFLNLVVIGQASAYLGMAASVAVFADLPSSLLPGEYFYIDSLALFEIMITSLLFLLAAVYSRGYISSLVQAGEIDSSILRLFYAAFCLLEMVTVLAFASNNLALLWIFIELSTFFSAVLIVTLKARENIIAALKYVFVASTAMLFSFIGIVLIYAASRSVIPGGSLNWTALYSVASQIDPRIFILAFVFIFLGFAAKAGVAPFHTWVPAAYVTAPSVVAVVSGTVLNLGMYAIIRLYAIGYGAGAGQRMMVFLSIFGTLSIAVAAFSMLKRTNTKKIIAFSGVESAGFLLIAVALGSPVAIYWALFYTLGYSLVKSLLFFCAGIFHRQYRSNKYFIARDALKLQPLASWGLIIGSAAAVGTPILPLFLAKWSILSGLSEKSIPLLVIILVLLLLAAVGLAYYFIRLFSQEGGEHPHFFQSPWSMKLPIILTLLGLVVLGVYSPAWLSETLNRIVTSLGF